MLVQGNVISYNANTKVAKQGGGTYDAWELVYRNQSNEVKTVTKPATGLRFNKALANGLADLTPGDDFTLVMEKKGQFWEAQSVTKGISEVQDDVQSPAVAQKDGNRSEARGGKVTGSNYETPEERAKKQVIIVRQSSVNTAIELLKAQGKSPELEETLEVAKKIETHVYKDFSKVAKKYLEVELKDAE